MTTKINIIKHAQHEIRKATSGTSFLPEQTSLDGQRLRIPSKASLLAPH